MESQNLLLSVLMAIFSIILCNSMLVNATSRRYRGPQHEYNDYGIRKLFVFGDSYADTGNLHRMWHSPPYGLSITDNPGKSRGRYSDGLVLTDYLAKFLGFKTPPAYHWRANYKEELHYGMNFAYGGAGVFQTLFPRPNISAQIDLFENLLNNSVYSTYDLESALFLVTLAGNDYVAYLTRTQNIIDLVMTFYKEVVDELAENLERLSKLGAKRVAVGSLQPVGCLPAFTAPDYKECNSTGDILVDLHNTRLQMKLHDLNAKRLTTNYLLIDLNSTFTDVIVNHRDSSGKLKFADSLRPCCEGSCGDKDVNGTKLYTVCKDPKSSFFWDIVHPTQAGWRAVFEALMPSFAQISSFIA